MMRTRMQGLTLVELMVSMVLGLVVIGGAVSLTLANRQTNRTNEGLSQVQEGARTALELLARDLRQAGVTGCDNLGRVANVLNPAAPDWWTDWFGMQGFEGDENSEVAFGTAFSERVADTDAMQLQGIQGRSFNLESHDTASGDIVITPTPNTNEFVTNDIIVACDFDHAAVFRTSNYNVANRRIRHREAAGSTPQNCARGLGFPTSCATTTGNTYAFPRNASVTHFFATEWYVGQTLRANESGRALFRRRIGAAGAEFTEEIVSGITDMQVTYRVEGDPDFVDADAVTGAQWPEVNAVRLVLTVDSAEARVSTEPGVNAGRLQRTFEQIVTLRNRVP